MICKPDFDNLQQVCRSQLAASLSFAICSKSAVRNLEQVCSSQVCRTQLAASLLTTCSRLVVIKPEQAMRTHPDIGLMIATCSKSTADLLQLARFWLCKFHEAIDAKEARNTFCDPCLGNMFCVTCCVYLCV